MIQSERELGDRFGSLLEIGCGEGHQTEHLAALAGEITGLDVSEIAVERARKRLPDAEFRVGDIYAQPWIDERGRFELVTACEVIYYMSDIPRFLQTMDWLGRDFDGVIIGEAGQGGQVAVAGGGQGAAVAVVDQLAEDGVHPAFVQVAEFGEGPVGAAVAPAGQEQHGIQEIGRAHV